MTQIEITIEDPRWAQANLHAIAQSGFDAAFVLLDLARAFEVSILGCDADRISKLNAEFRDKSTATNVLSWPAEDLSPDVQGEIPLRPSLDTCELGDIAICYEVCAQEAVDQGKPFDHHVTHLMVHGLLHLLGYDHETDQDAALMETIETRILANLGIADPYS